MDTWNAICDGEIIAKIIDQVIKCSFFATNHYLFSLSNNIARMPDFVGEQFREKAIL